MNHDDFPAGGHWPGARNFISLAELSGVTPRRAGTRNFPTLAELSGVAPKRSGGRNSINLAELSGVTPERAGARNFISLAELSGVAPERSDTRAARRRPIPDRPSRAPAAAINIAAVRALVDEKRRAMSASEWAQATEDGAMVARGMRALKTLPDPQAAMPAFRRKMAEVGVTESAIASIPQIWDARLADVVIAAYGEMGKLPVPPSRMPGAFTDTNSATITGDDRMGDTGFKDWAGSRDRDPFDQLAGTYADEEEEAEILRRERARQTPSDGSGFNEDSEPLIDIWSFRGIPYDESGKVKLTDEQKELNEIYRMTTSEGDEPPIVNMEKARQFAIQEGIRAKFEIERATTKHDGGRPWYRLDYLGKSAVRKYNPIIDREARRQGVDPDLVRAIMFIEHADGHFGGGNVLAERFGVADSLLPMNIDPKIWAGVGGVHEEEFEVPEMNIRAGVALIREIRDRIADPNPNAAQIGSIYVFAGRESIDSYGARVGRAFRERAWER